MNFSDHPHQRSQTFIKLALIAIMHGLLAFVLLRDLRKETLTKPEITVTLIKEVVKPPPIERIKPPPTPQGKPAAPHLRRPAPALVEQRDTSTKNDLITIPDSTFAIEAPGQSGGAIGSSGSSGTGISGTGTGSGTERKPVRVRAIVGPDACERPALSFRSIRNQETGLVVLAMLIDVDGRVKESKIMKSSGFDALDQTAKDGLQLCRFMPATLDGVPVPSWELFKYSWTVNGR